MVLMTSITLGIIGYLMLWQVRKILEDQFSHHLVTISKWIEKNIDLEQVQLVDEFSRTNRTYYNLKSQFLRLKNETDLQRIFVFNRSWQSIVDTDSLITIGHFYYDLMLDKNEIQQLQNVNHVASTLFEDNQGRLFKRAYSQLTTGKQVYYLGIESTTEALLTWKKIRNIFIYFSVIILFFSFFTAYFFAKSIIVPVQSLVKLTSEIQRGNLNQKIEMKNNDEIGALAQSMEKMRQSILRRNQQQKIILAGIAHEVRNPLAGVDMFAGIIESETKEESIKKYSHRILQESKQIQKILTDFNEYGQPIKPDLGVCSLLAAIREAQELLQSDIDKKSIMVLIEANQNDYKIRFDLGHLRQILLNLLRNAIHYSTIDSAIRITITELARTTVVEISNTGPGIKADNQGKIFEPFFSTDKGHTGLGLTIVRNLLEENGGNITLLPTKDGATFRIILNTAIEAGK